MELTDTSLRMTHQEAGALADFMRDFDGLNGRGVHGDEVSTEEHRLRRRQAAIAVYRLVSPDFNKHVFETSDSLEIPREHLPKMQEVIDARLMNPVSAIDRACEFVDEGYSSYNAYAREDAFKRLAWLSQVYVALDGVNDTPHYPLDILNSRFSSLEQLPSEDSDEYEDGELV